MIDSIEKDAIGLVGERTGCTEKSTSQTLWLDLGVDGHDGIELLESIAKQFSVDMTNCTPSDYFGPDSFGPGALYCWARYFIMKDKYQAAKLKPLSVQMLIDAAKRKYW